MAWWGWMVAGIVLLGVELLIIDAQFFLVFLGLAAIAVGLAALGGIGGPEWVQWVLFAVLAVIFMFGFRGRLYQKLRGNVPGFDDSLTGQTVVLEEAIAPGGEGRAVFRGTTWRIHNAGHDPIESGGRARITHADGLVLRVKRID